MGKQPTHPECSVQKPSIGLDSEPLIHIYIYIYIIILSIFILLVNLTTLSIFHIIY
jgi:hypothetical protein